MKLKQLLFALLFSGATVLGTACSVASPGLALQNEIGDKVGEAKIKNLFGFSWGNGSINAAAKDGNIDKIATVDYRIESGLFMTKYVTVVTGK